MKTTRQNSLEKLVTNIPGFDHITCGGLPKHRTSLVSGSSGSGKSVFAVQFLAEGIMKSGGNGVYVTFEEPPENIRTNMASLGWDIKTWEKEGKWLFVDASAPDEDQVEAGSYDLGALLARIKYAIGLCKADRVSLDSLDGIFTQLSNRASVRRELSRIALALKQMKVTSVMTVERISEYGDISRFGVEEFVADNVIILRNVLEEEKRRRTVEILKLRGTIHKKGEHPFTIVPSEGVIVIPLSSFELTQKSSKDRVTWGNKDLDAMCDGGLFQDSISLISGATGTGKTMISIEYICGGLNIGERTLLFAFEESREQIFRNASNFGTDFEQMEREGMLKVICQYPEIMGLEDHLNSMNKAIHDFKPKRLAVDSISALERVATRRGFREFVIGLVASIKEQQIAGLFTSTTPTLPGGASVTEAHISSITDLIILLRNLELNGEMRRGLTVLKMRGSQHDKNIRELFIDSSGIRIGKPYRNVTGILAGHPAQTTPDEPEPRSSK
jgi:circadian clock protein KaiC